MPRTLSPLRYPGGKTKLYPLVKKIIEVNNLGGTYIEPFAGGAGLAIKLLMNGDVKRIIINDSDPAIYAFWYCVKEHAKELCDFIDEVSLTIEEWKKQREIYLNYKDKEIVDLGKATLFLNRVNVSGVIKGGVIGGKAQNGSSRMDARFNRAELKKKIINISSLKDRIIITNLDILDFMLSDIFKRKRDALFYFDPPYVKKGGQLYLNYFHEEDHQKLFRAISKCKKNWIVTYDESPFILNLYRQFRYEEIEVNYSASSHIRAKEYMFFSRGLVMPELY